MSIKAVNSFILRAARKSDEMLEPYDGKLSRTVLRRESGSNLADLVDYGELSRNLGGTFIDMMSGKYMINVLEPKLWSNDSEEDNDEDVPATFKKTTVLSQHISFLKDFFKTYKDFSDEQIDTLEIMLTKLYKFFIKT